jgi:ribosomal protein S18 acetylase RimI-like enzyme
MTIRIMDATPEDHDSIRQVQRQTWIATYPNEEFGITKEDIEMRFAVDTTPQGIRRGQERRQNINANPLIHTWVAKDGEASVGFCIAQKEHPQNRIKAIYVLPEYQGTRVGKQLMQTALDWLGDQHDIALAVASYNHKAISFYHRFGFVLNGDPVASELAGLSSGVIIPEIEMIKPATQS